MERILHQKIDRKVLESSFNEFELLWSWWEWKGNKKLKRSVLKKGKFEANFTFQLSSQSIEENTFFDRNFLFGFLVGRYIPFRNLLFEAVKEIWLLEGINSIQFRPKKLFFLIGLNLHDWKWYPRTGKFDDITDQKEKSESEAYKQSKVRSREHKIFDKNNIERNGKAVTYLCSGHDGGLKNVYIDHLCWIQRTTSWGQWAKNTTGKPLLGPLFSVTCRSRAKLRVVHFHPGLL